MYVVCTLPDGRENKKVWTIYYIFGFCRHNNYSFLLRKLGVIEEWRLGSSGFIPFFFILPFVV
jgi:hypothetical protein